MKFRITGVDLYGDQDSTIVEHETLEGVVILAKAECDKRGWCDLWSEQIDEGDDQ